MIDLSPYRTILIPLDGSEEAKLALKFARFIPCQRIRLLKVEPNFQVLAPGPLSEFRPDWKEIRTQQVEAELAAIAQEHLPGGIETELAVRYGDAAYVIVDEPDADLIIMTTHGRGAAGRALFGSTADHVIRNARVPTLLVRVGSKPVPPVQPKRIVVSLSGDPLGEGALPEAVRLAKILRLPLHLIRVVNVDWVLREIGIERQSDSAADIEETTFITARSTAEHEAEAYLASIAKRIESEGVTVSTEVRTGTPVFEILDALTPSDIVVMTTRGYGGLRRIIMGSVAERLVREAPSPIMIARPAMTPRE